MLRIGQVTVDYLVNPVGITKPPQFGWKIESDKSNVMQTTYRLQIAYDRDFQKLVFDSGIVESEQSVHVEAEGLELSSSTRYYLKVKMTDGSEESDWSQTAFFTTALLSHEEWRGEFVSAETKADAANSKVTRLRRRFDAQSGIASAVVYSTALGLYKLYINGKRVGEDELAPGWTSYRKHLLYQTYDVTELVQSGENAIGAMLGAGWYKGLMGFAGLRNHYGEQTALLCQLEITYTDGSKNVVVTDKSWKGADSPVLFSEIYDGEVYDARLEEDGWHCPHYDDEAWKPVELVDYDTSVLTSQTGCKGKEIDRIPAKELIITPQGDTVINFGQNLTGWVHFKVKGQAGECVELNHFEVLDAAGNVYLDNLRQAKQTVSYTLKGGEEESFHPHFTFQGFQYIKVAKYPGEIDLKNFEAVSVHSEMTPTGTFECSNKDINQLHHNILWGMKGNFVDVPTDCPQRNERLGWTGDAQIFCRTASYLMDTYTFFSKWLKDVKADQTAEGGVPHVVPDIVSGKADDDWLLGQGSHSAAAWADVAVIMPWTLYLQYGDTRILEEQYGSMKAWIDFMQEHAVNGIWNYKLQFGDWVALDAKEGSYFGATPNDLVATAYYAYSTELFSKIAKKLGKEEDYHKYSTLHLEIVKTFQNEFFTPTGRMAARTQTAHIVALYFNLVPDAFRQRTIHTLIELLEENDGHLVTGFVGTPYFCHALSQNGRLKEAYELLLKDDFPSWLYQVKAGATTIWEHWDGIKPDGTMWSPDMNSFNHYAYGAIGEWLYRAAAGIEADECEAGYKHTIIQPHVGGGLEYVKASYSSVYGDISVSWNVAGNKVHLEVAIPPNTSATIVLEQAKSVASGMENEFARNEKGLSTKVGSGKYSFSYWI
ncbi:glycoside hydrolase family 78 protein [Paenibacillus sp. N4]|uniref:alpha-L-rhamnosidase n=1 Tax=Paenibacillus vietnamensis TaxID=2590547 RepID=UPI001CD044F8|nr:alpha-L-rhamnosidase [Paenibacillus vietnamensis]MCA0757069.1 glycoside hydrolase family 78 protein [Paenibacillus vietnamensis]